MPAYRIWHHKVPEGVDWEPMDRLVGRNDALLTTADVDHINISIYDARDRVLLYEQLGIGAGNGIDGPIFDSLQTDARWKPGPPGYNSRHLLTPTLFLAYATPFVPEPRHHYRVEIVTFSDTWNKVPSVHDYEVLSVYSEP